MILAFAKRLLPLSLVALLLPACGGLVPFVDAHTWLKAVLRGSQEVPATASVQTGLAIFGVTGQQTAIDYSVTHSVAVVSSVDIHLGAPGTNGPILFTLTPAASPMIGSLAPVDLTPSPTDGINSFVDACNAMLAGNTYIDIKVATVGQIRGQIGSSLLKARTIIGKHVVPPITTTATASATFQLTMKDSASVTIPADIDAEIAVTLTSTNLTLADVTGVFIHAGSPSTASSLANVMFTLFSTGTFTNPFAVTLTLAHFTPQGAIDTMDKAINALLSGGAYIEVETGTNPGGEIRGQIGAMRFLTTTFDDTQEVTTPTNSGSGTGSIVLNGTQDALTYLATFTLGGTGASGALRVAPAGLNGPVLFDLTNSPFASPLSGVRDEADIDGGSGLTTFLEVIEALLQSKTYFEIRTVEDPTGEIRGQLSP